jgi:hypothetical protein
MNYPSSWHNHDILEHSLRVKLSYPRGKSNFEQSQRSVARKVDWIGWLWMKAALAIRHAHNSSASALI